MKIVMLAYPGMTPLDLLGPLQTWSQWPEAEIQVVWKKIEPIMTDTGMAVLPTHSFAESFANPDILFAPNMSTISTAWRITGGRRDRF